MYKDIVEKISRKRIRLTYVCVVRLRSKLGCFTQLKDVQLLIYHYLCTLLITYGNRHMHHDVSKNLFSLCSPFIK
jgi:hypothetical protein